MRNIWRMGIRHGECHVLCARQCDTSRRSFLRQGAGLLALQVLSACSASADGAAPTEGQPAGDAFVVDGPDVIITLGRVPSLSRDNSAAVLLAAQVIVVRVSAGDYRAFSAECPHAGCGVSIVDGSRLLCPCHGSAFDFAGARLDGPAPRGLWPLPVAHDTTAATLRIRRG